MINRIIGFLKRVFVRRKECTEIDSVQPVTVAEKEITVRTSCIYRVRRILQESGIRPLRGRLNGTWYIRTESFNDAYRLLLRMGRQEELVCRRKGGHIIYMLPLPDGNGSITLSDNLGNRKNTVALMNLNVAEMSDIKEIRFRFKSKINQNFSSSRRA